MAKKVEIDNQFENIIQQTAQKNKEKAEQKAIERIENPIESYIEKNIEKPIEKIENDGYIEENTRVSNKIEFEINLGKNANDEKQVKSYYFKKSTIKNIKKYAKLYNMKDSVFIETILEQFFLGEQNKKNNMKK